MNKSKCCNAGVSVGGKRTTHWFICDSCGWACDIKNNRPRSWLFTGVAIGLVLSVLFLLFSGCHQAQVIAPNLNITPVQVVTKTILKQDWIVTGSILGVAIGVFGLLNGSRYGVSFIVSCLAALAMTLATERYAFWIAGIGFGVSILLSAYAVITRQIAVKELVKTVDVLKTTPYIAAKSVISAVIQSAETQRIVQGIRDTLEKPVGTEPINSGMSPVELAAVKPLDTGTLGPIPGYVGTEKLPGSQG